MASAAVIRLDFACVIRHPGLKLKVPLRGFPFLARVDQPRLIHETSFPKVIADHKGNAVPGKLCTVDNGQWRRFGERPCSSREVPGRLQK